VATTPEKKRETVSSLPLESLGAANKRISRRQAENQTPSLSINHIKDK